MNKNIVFLLLVSICVLSFPGMAMVFRPLTFVERLDRNMLSNGEALACLAIPVSIIGLVKYGLDYKYATRMIKTHEKNRQDFVNLKNQCEKVQAEASAINPATRINSIQTANDAQTNIDKINKEIEQHEADKKYAFKALCLFGGIGSGSLWYLFGKNYGLMR